MEYVNLWLDVLTARGGREEGAACLLWGRCVLARDGGMGPGDGAEACAAAGEQRLIQMSPEAGSCHGLDTKHMVRKAVEEESDLLHAWLNLLATSGTDGGGKNPLS